jgi:ribosome biogenesis GTPase
MAHGFGFGSVTGGMTGDARDSRNDDVSHALIDLGFVAHVDDVLIALGVRRNEMETAGRLGRVSRLDRGWSTVLRSRNDVGLRVRNIGADVAVGDWVIVDEGVERVETVLERRSALTRRASADAVRAESHTLAANIDVVFIVQAADQVPNPRRLERELALAFDSGATPVIVLNKTDAVSADVVASRQRVVEGLAAGVHVVCTSASTGIGVDAIERYARDGRATVAFLGASGVGKSSLVNALLGETRQTTGEVREGDRRGKHTTTAAELIALEDGGWLLDTPGVRAVSLWVSGRGIERTFPEIFALAEACRFRDCKHDEEPGCAVQDAIARGEIDPERLRSMKSLVAEEVELEDSRDERERMSNRKGARKPRGS